MSIAILPMSSEFHWNSTNSSPFEDPELGSKEKKLIFTNRGIEEPVKTIPWRIILSKAPV